MAVDVAEPRLAPEQGDPVAQTGDRVDVEVGLGAGVDHPVVGDHDDPHLVGQLLAQLLDVLVDVAQLRAPALESTPARWPCQSRSPS